MSAEDEEQYYVEPDAETDALCRSVIGAAIEVHRHLGPGLDEALYGAALCIEFELRGIPYEREVVIPVFYKGRQIGTKRLDFVIGKKLIVEIKAIEQIAAVHMAQVNTYLKITLLKVGLLLNFNTAVLKNGIKRIIRS